MSTEHYRSWLTLTFVDVFKESVAGFTAARERIVLQEAVGVLDSVTRSVTLVHHDACV